MLKAFIIKIGDGKDLGDVVQIARSLGQQAFHTRGHVKVKRVYGPDSEFGYVAVVECSTSSDVRGPEASMQNV